MNVSSMESAVTRHYSTGGLLERIFHGIEASGLDKNDLQPEDLSPVDEFHIGGRKSTQHVVAKLGLKEGQHVLDVGCGIGGASRYMAAQSGGKVTGIDLTPEYIETAKALTQLTGQTDQIDFHVASALDMPFGGETFDAAISIHVAMNIEDRVGLYGEIARVLRPGAKFCLYDVMKKGAEKIQYPVPWADTEETSFVTSPEEMQSLLKDAGFTVDTVEDRTDFALDYFRQNQAAMADGPPPLGTHLVVGASAPEKFKNVRENIQTGRIAPVQMIARR